MEDTQMQTKWNFQEFDFRKRSIIPSKGELLGEHVGSELPENKVNGQKYESVSEYLSTQFLLLRQDCIQPYCDGIRALMKGATLAHDLQVYRDVKLLTIRCGKSGMEYRVSFRMDRYPVDWGSSKCLMEGTLLCVTSDNFDTFIWAITTGHKRTSMEGDYVHLKCLPVFEESKLEYKKTYIMVESPAAFFEAYCHVLENLQKPELTMLPFVEHLVSLEPLVEPPDYLSRGSKQDVLYDFSCVFPEMNQEFGCSVFPVLQDWPSWNSLLDPSQITAVRHGLTKRLALIQGPPGTGKTFVGKVIAALLLHNLGNSTGVTPSFERDRENFHAHKRFKLSKDVLDGPLLILCYTNHALDQFLEGVFEFEKSLIRYGGRSTSIKLSKCTVKHLIKKERQGLLRSLWDRHRQILRKADKIKFYISKCQTLMCSEHVSYDTLCQVASAEQVDNLFFSGSNCQIVQLWLQGLSLHSACKLMEGSKPSQEEAVRTLTDGFQSASAGELGPDEEDADLPEELIFHEPYVWLLGRSARSKLHAEWLRRIRIRAERRLLGLLDDYQNLCLKKKRLDEEIHFSILSRARVVGMTTTAAARCHSILMRMKPKVILVEEAAEILEGHVIACLTPYTQHLILIGDHMQLRPSVAVNKLATDYSLDVSLFERLIMGGIEHVTLEYQRRMRPCISQLLHCIYPSLKDHFSVLELDNVTGMCNNVYFVDHRGEEKHLIESKSKVNFEESAFVVELYLYLLKQGSYLEPNITILTMYRGQVQCIKSTLQERMERQHFVSEQRANLHRAASQITCVDDYQGEESDIIILSLVRNVRHSGKDHGGESIGFLENSNRVCVALSRARKGLFIFGNAELLASKSVLWGRILHNLRQSNSVGRFLVLSCQNHFLKETEIHKADDFWKVIDGGCNIKCRYELDCGHPCPQYCHPGGHEHTVCISRCSRLLPCMHRCMLKCHGFTPCPACRMKVQKHHHRCGHGQMVPCSSFEFRCEEPCSALLPCGHRCCRRCGEDCTRRCPVKVKKELPCGHFALMPCHRLPSTHVCRELCGKSLEPFCSHSCQGSCTSCRMTNVHPQCCQRCEKILPCGHQCKSLCYETCQPCLQPCENRCIHRHCQHKCGDLCSPCLEPCSWGCDHYKCSLTCHEVCDRPRCNKKCPKVLKCGHYCIGLCGEPCPTRCRVCHPHTIETFSQLKIGEMEREAQFVQLLDCGHLCEFGMLDHWMGVEESNRTEAGCFSNQLKTCPRCMIPIRKTIRYRGIINSYLLDLEKSKKQILNMDSNWSKVY